MIYCIYGFKIHRRWLKYKKSEVRRGNMKEKLVIIGANDFQNQLILKAKSMRI